MITWGGIFAEQTRSIFGCLTPRDQAHTLILKHVCVVGVASRTTSMTASVTCAQARTATPTPTPSRMNGWQGTTEHPSVHATRPVGICQERKKRERNRRINESSDGTACSRQSRLPARQESMCLEPHTRSRRLCMAAQPCRARGAAMCVPSHEPLSRHAWQPAAAGDEISHRFASSPWFAREVRCHSRLHSRPLSLAAV